MTILETKKPMGTMTWNSVAEEFDAWALLNGCPQHGCNSLKCKFKEIIQRPKPTGHAACPAYVDHVHIILVFMDGKFCTLNPDNDNNDNEDCIKITDSSNDKTTYSKILSTNKVVIKQEPGVKPEEVFTVSCHAQATTLSCPSKNAGNDFLCSISMALDPQVQATIAKERSTQMMQATQILSLTTQVHDGQLTIETLHTHILDLKHE